jgi:hypothetical protein
MMRYPPARHYLSFGIVAFALAAFSAWLGLRWAPGFIPAALFLLNGAILIYLAYRPAIELYSHHLAMGSRTIHWLDIRRIDRTGWVSPLLIVRLTLFDDSRVTLIYPGNLDSSQALLRHLRRACRDALIDGVPYRQYWGEMLSASSGVPGQALVPRYRLLRSEDEAEVERLYQRLKTVGNLEQKPSSDEK